MKVWTCALGALVLVCGLSSVASAQTAATALILSALCGDPQDGQTLIYDADNDEWGCGSPADLVQPLIDSIALMKDDGDATKLLAFELSGLTTATTRTITWPDANLTIPSSIASLGANTFTGDQSISGTVTATSFSGSGSSLTDLDWGAVTDTPTTLSGYGITDAQPLDADLTSWAAITRASGFDTFAATSSSANLRALLTDEVGTGAAYFVGGALGTPASATLTNATGLPVSTGISGLGTGVATFLATPSGSNLASALTSALPATKGGTGLTSFTTGDLIYASAANTLSTLTACEDGETLVYDSGIPACDSGEWVDVPFNAGNFTGADSMTWTVESGDQVTFAYRLIGKTLTIALNLAGTSISGTPSNYMQVALPAGLVAANTVSVGSARGLDNGVHHQSYAEVDASGTMIRIAKVNMTNFSASTNNTNVSGVFTIRVQ